MTPRPPAAGAQWVRTGRRWGPIVLVVVLAIYSAAAPKPSCS